MGIKGIKMGLCFAAIMVAGLIGESMAQRPPDPCIPAIATMLPCLPFLMADEEKPTAGCCAAYSGVLLSQPNCLCTDVNGGAPLPLLNLTLAHQLPYSCNVKVNDPDRSPCPSSTPTAPSPTPPSVLESGCRFARSSETATSLKYCHFCTNPNRHVSNKWTRGGTLRSPSRIV
nr:non-specific lipid-transfer protein-like protein At2g13820 [Ipomoea batatas]